MSPIFHDFNKNSSDDESTDWSNDTSDEINDTGKIKITYKFANNCSYLLFIEYLFLSF